MAEVESESLVDPELLKVLACPLCADRPSLSLKGDYLVCGRCQNAFPVKDGIPQLTPEDAVPLSQIEDHPDD